MKKIILRTSILYVLLSIIFLNGCNKENESVAPKAKPDSSNSLSSDQIASMNSEADLVAKQEVARLKSRANLRDVIPSQDFIGLNVNSVTPTGPTAATYAFTGFIQNAASIQPSLQASYNSVFCAAAGHMRYCVVYLYNGYTHTMSSGITSFNSPTGGCMTGTTNFSQNFGGPNTSQLFVVVFDVLMGPPGGSTQIAQIWSNTRDLTYPNLTVYNKYWY